MRQLTTRQRFALIFTSYIFLFIVLLYSLFFLIFTFMSGYQIKEHLANDMNEIVNNHILIDNGKIIFRKDRTGSSLRQFLLNENASAIIIDNKQVLIRAYGSFASGSDKNSYEKSIIPLITLVEKTQSLKSSQIIWNNETFESLTIPLINKGNFIGL